MKEPENENNAADGSVESSDLFGYCRHCGDRLFRPESTHCSQTCSDYDRGRDTYTGRPLTRIYSIDQRNEKINKHKRFMDAIKLRDLRERNEQNAKSTHGSNDRRKRKEDPPRKWFNVISVQQDGPWLIVVENDSRLHVSDFAIIESKEISCAYKVLSWSEGKQGVEVIIEAIYSNAGWTNLSQADRNLIKPRIGRVTFFPNVEGRDGGSDVRSGGAASRRSLP